MQDITARASCALSLQLISVYDTGLTDDIFIELKSAWVRGSAE